MYLLLITSSSVVVVVVFLVPLLQPSILHNLYYVLCFDVRSWIESYCSLPLIWREYKVKNIIEIQCLLDILSPHSLMKLFLVLLTGSLFQRGFQLPVTHSLDNFRWCHTNENWSSAFSWLKLHEISNFI